MHEISLSSFFNDFVYGIVWSAISVYNGQVGSFDLSFFDHSDIILTYLNTCL